MLTNTYCNTKRKAKEISYNIDMKIARNKNATKHNKDCK